VPAQQATPVQTPPPPRPAVVPAVQPVGATVPAPRVTPAPAMAPPVAPPPRPVTAPAVPSQQMPPPRVLPPRPVTPANVTANAATPASIRPAVAPVAIESPAQSLPVLAPEVLEELEAVMGNDYLGLIKLFLEDAPKQIQQLEQAAADNNIHGMIAPAHTLKSSSANLGALALSAIAKRIEIGARGNALNRPTVAVVMLEAEYKKAQNALQAMLQ